METKHYSPADIEAKWYQHWNESGYFRSTPDEREPFTIVIPPPNVTGVLHMGHLLNNTIQDILIRRARMQGKNACWVPGTDHASIATEAKVVQMLRARGIKKSDLSRDEFLSYAWEWKEKYGGIILNQLQRLGASCDWERTRFTMEPKLSDAVVKVFVDLYNKKKIYRGLRMINWDPEAKTVLSGEEVVFAQEQSQLYHVRYQIEGTDNEWITIATTRPETILADAAVAVHPNDERYAHLTGRRCIVPIVERSVPIIFDAYVEKDFGTGALKVTPAHDVNDYELGKKHGLEVIDMFNEDGTLNAAAQFYIGKDRFWVRKQIAKDLAASEHLVKQEPYLNNVGRSERTNAVIEPRLSLQWFVDMPALAKPALDGVMNGELDFVPPHFKNTYKYWMENIRDWCISRQLWWGHRIPAWYVSVGGEREVFVAETAADALAQAQKALNNKDLTLADLQQDEDVLDTWFSSWLWPISVFDGFESQEELNYYYPTDVLVTGFDIIFFWVARMIMAGYEFAGDLVPAQPKVPFKKVYFTGMVRDRLGRKMSKSLGNSPDALALLDRYGADGVRFGMLFCSPAGGDLMFDAPYDAVKKETINESALCEQGRNFCNKLFNATRLIKGWELTETADAEILAVNSLAAAWFNQKLNKTAAEVNVLLDDFRLSEALKALYSFVWDDFCSWYLEMIKPVYGQPIAAATQREAIHLFEQCLVLLHPFVPFITEQIWHDLAPRSKGDDLILKPYILGNTYDTQLIANVETAIEVIQKVREQRNKNGISPKEQMPLFVQNSVSAQALFAISGWKSTVTKLANLSALTTAEAAPDNTVQFIGGTDNYYLLMNKTIDADAERARLTQELGYLRGFLESVNKKLGNERFVQNAKPEVLAIERKKESDALTKIKILEESLARL